MPLPNAILCIDFDGTLIDAQISIHPVDVEILKHFPPSIQPVITTGRDLHSVKSILQEHGVFKGLSFPLPGVFMNGGLTCRPGEAVVECHAFPEVSRRALIELAHTSQMTAFTFFSRDAVYLVNSNPFGRRISVSHHLAAQEISPFDVPGEIIKVMVLEPDAEVMKQVKGQMQGLAAEMAVSLPYAFEINPEGINKASSLLVLLERMHMERVPIFAVGDAENDLALFQLAHASFAPSHAHPKALRAADHHIQREENGLLKPILAYLIAS